VKVYVIPADAHGCGHNRLIWPASALQRQGFDVTIIPPGPKSGFLAETDNHGNLASLNIPEDADVLVLQRPAHPLQPQMIQLLRQNGRAVVVDMDDDMSTIDPHNIAFHMYRPRSGSPFSWKHAAESCKVATLVTTSTAALAKTYGGHGRVRVIDNYVPATCLTYPQTQTGVFGWAGTLKSHPNDLQITGRAIQQVVDAGHEFMVVGDGEGVQKALRLTDQPMATGTTSLVDWIRTIGDTMDVGIIPLAPGAFNTAKSRLKGIESMAAGVAWVASPRAEYRRLSREAKCGLLADTPKQWTIALKRLLTDDNFRKEQVEAGTAYMQDQTYEAQCWRHAEAWTTAYEMERR
jgi:glycosyltransferase involved in cell wall biosynthesis